MMVPSKRSVQTARAAIKVPGARKIVSSILPGFSRRLAAMLSAGMPIVSCLNSLRNNTKNPNFRYVLERVKRTVENGTSLSDALRPFSCIFDEIYINMVHSGETSGQLVETMKRLAGFLETRAKFRHKVRSAMIYPLVVLSIALLIASGLVVFIVPVFEKMFSSFNARLPAPTQFLFDVSMAIRHYGVLILLAMFAAVVVFKKWRQTPAGSYQFDLLLLRLPVVGQLNREVACVRFAGTFGSLIRSGVPILAALDISAGATGNKVAARVIRNASGQVEIGKPLSEALTRQTVFPSMLVEMLQAGEGTGKIDEMMDCVSDFFEDEVNATLAGLTSLLDPMLMVFLGVIIGGIVVSMFLPIFKLPGLL